MQNMLSIIIIQIFLKLFEFFFGIAYLFLEIFMPHDQLTVAQWNYKVSLVVDINALGFFYMDGRKQPIPKSQT